MPKDPVCLMEVDERSAAGQMMYKDAMYYFCALGCRDAFEKDPEKYLRQQEDVSDGNSRSNG